MKLSKIIEVWETLHVKDCGEIGYCELEKAIEKADGIENDIDTCLPVTQRATDGLSSNNRNTPY